LIRPRPDRDVENGDPSDFSRKVANMSRENGPTVKEHFGRMQWRARSKILIAASVFAILRPVHVKSPFGLPAGRKFGAGSLATIRPLSLRYSSLPACGVAPAAMSESILRKDTGARFGRPAFAGYDCGIGRAVFFDQSRPITRRERRAHWRCRDIRATGEIELIGRERRDVRAGSLDRRHENA
jgi:hypothetical protein